MKKMYFAPEIQVSDLEPELLIAESTVIDPSSEGGSDEEGNAEESRIDAFDWDNL